MYRMTQLYRPAFINNMFIRHGCGKETRELLEKLGDKELAILSKNQDLLERVKEISKMSYLHLNHVIGTQYGLKVDNWSGGDFLLSTAELDQKAPSWWGSTHIGWTFDTGNPPQFCSWARDFLMQEVRINIWMRYIEYKRAALKSAVPEIDPADILAAAASGGHGNYL